MPRLPIVGVRYPASLAGFKNGQLPSTALHRVPLDDGRGAWMEITAARAFEAMFAAARNDLDGLKVRHVGDYRPFSRQLEMFVDRYKPVSAAVYYATRSSARKRWRDAGKYGYESTYWVKNRPVATSATPGTSNHGWGLALDVAEQRDGDSSPDPISSRFVNWLIVHAGRFGVSAELQSEPWHWRYVAGDVIPKAVLDYENPPPPPPPPKPTPPPTPKFQWSEPMTTTRLLDPEVRIIDTRDAPHREGHLVGPLVKDELFGVLIPQPDGKPVGGVTLNVTVTDTTGPGFLQLWGLTYPGPDVAKVNWDRAGATVSSCVTVAVAAVDGQVHGVFKACDGNVVLSVVEVTY